MNRTLTYEKSYYIRNYEILKVFDSFVEIPEEHVFNEEAIDTIRQLQVNSAELLHQKYLTLENTIKGLTPEDAEQVLTKVQETLLEKLKTILQESK